MSGNDNQGNVIENIENPFFLLSALSTGCTYYQVVKGTYSTVSTGKFDRSWSATVNAFLDQGVAISREDSGAGMVQGTRNGIEVTGFVRTQADGSVRVEFNTSGAVDRDPDLIRRISWSYDARMGS